MKLCVKWILEQYAALKLYFTNAVTEDATHTNDSILSSLINKVIQAYLEFMDFNLGRMLSFNVLFQSKMPLLHKLNTEVEKLMKAICLDFTEVAYVKNTGAFDIDPSRSDNHIALNNVYHGVLATSTLYTIKEECGSDDPGIPIIYSQCRDFLIEAVKQIQERLIDCKKLDVLSCLSPDVAYNLKIPSNFSPKKYCQIVLQEKNVSGKQAKPILVKVVKVLHSLPYSNAAVEQVFSQLKLRLIKGAIWSTKIYSLC